MKIMLISDSGEVLDSTEISREDLANLSPTGAYAILHDLQPGQES